MVIDEPEVAVKLRVYRYYTQCCACARYYLEDILIILKIQDSILCIFRILLKNILTKTRGRYFLKILFTLHCVRYSTRIISQPLRICIHYKITGMTIILEHKSSN